MVYPILIKYFPLPDDQFLNAMVNFIFTLFYKIEISVLFSLCSGVSILVGHLADDLLIFKVTVKNVSLWLFSLDEA